MDRLVDPGDFPKVILLDTCAFCNYKCSMCGHKSMTRPKGMMELHLFYKLIDEIADKSLNTRVWLVFFGELFVRADFFKLIFYAKSKGLTDVVLNTNGALLSAAKRAEIIDSNLDAIYIGIDAFTEQIYNKLRVGGDFKLVNDRVRLLIQEAKVARHPKVYVQFVEMEENTDEVEKFTEYWLEQGAIVKIRPKVTWAGAVSPSGVKQIERYSCHWAMQTMSILWDGRVCLCACDYDGQYIGGDVNSNSIQKVWLDMKPIRDAHTSEQWDKLPAFCQKCTDWQMAKAEYRED